MYADEVIFRCLRAALSRVSSLSITLTPGFAYSPYIWTDLHRPLVLCHEHLTPVPSWPLPQHMSIQGAAIRGFFDALQSTTEIPILINVKELEIRGARYVLDPGQGGSDSEPGQLVEALGTNVARFGVFDRIIVEEDDLVCLPTLEALKVLTRPGGFAVIRHYEDRPDEPWLWPITDGGINVR